LIKDDRDHFSETQAGTSDPSRVVGLKKEQRVSLNANTFLQLIRFPKQADLKTKTLALQRVLDVDAIC